MTPGFRQRTKALGNTFRLERGMIHPGPEEIELALRPGQNEGIQPAGRQRIELNMTVTAVYPESELVDANPKLFGIRSAWLNIFGFRVDLACLANNATGDACQFVMYKHADQAYHTPPLFNDFTALDMVRMSLHTYFDGFAGYRDDFQDVAPSTIIAAWNKT